MLLTVIAVATLFVAIVGASFAYFTANSINNTQKTLVTSYTKGTSSIELTSPETNLKLILDSEEMAKDNKNSSYYSVISTSEKKYTKNENEAFSNVLMASLSGDDDGEYVCHASVKVSLSALNETTLDNLKDEDGSIVFGGVLPSVSKKLTEIKTGNKHELLLEDVVFSGIKKGVTKELKAYLVINNTNVPQNYLQNEELKVTFEAPSFYCDEVN